MYGFGGALLGRGNVYTIIAVQYDQEQAKWQAFWTSRFIEADQRTESSLWAANRELFLPQSAGSTITLLLVLWARSVALVLLCQASKLPPSPHCQQPS